MLMGLVNTELDVKRRDKLKLETSSETFASLHSCSFAICMGRVVGLLALSIFAT